MQNNTFTSRCILCFAPAKFLVHFLMADNRDIKEIIFNPLYTFLQQVMPTTWANTRIRKNMYIIIWLCSFNSAAMFGGRVPPQWAMEEGGEKNCKFIFSSPQILLCWQLFDELWVNTITTICHCCICKGFWWWKNMERAI